jgi:hypothetical protein
MRFYLPRFVGKRIEAGGDGLLLGQWRKADLLIEKPVFFDADAVGGAFAGGFAQFDERCRADQLPHEGSVASLGVAKLE